MMLLFYLFSWRYFRFLPFFFLVNSCLFLPSLSSLSLHWTQLFLILTCMPYLLPSSLYLWVPYFIFLLLTHSGLFVFDSSFTLLHAFGLCPIYCLIFCFGSANRNWDFVFNHVWSCKVISLLRFVHWSFIHFFLHLFVRSFPASFLPWLLPYLVPSPLGSFLPCYSCDCEICLIWANVIWFVL